MTSESDRDQGQPPRCSACKAELYMAWSMYLGEFWASAYPQGRLPAGQCPQTPGMLGVRFGSHAP
ncbi:hypothetical protein FHR32_005167 [Streptosporangium album]|uniref:Uncharacterized protein n=1 Tax=Streptosporangium album TaxID=47479 RepID=A0A7W7RZ41_9ACTN|nr:hypothetical protein [Streptosporangium album]